MKKILNIKNLSELSKETVAPAISIYMPMKISGKERAENEIRLGNLLKSAETKLISAGTEKDYVKKILAPALALRADSLFWRQTNAVGLALFLTPPRIFRYFELPDPVEESLYIENGFRLDPLREAIGKNRDFYLLAASKNNLELYLGTNGRLEKQEVKNMPKGIKELMPDKKFEKNLESHGSSPRGKAEIMHGQGGEKDIQKTLLQRYFQDADKAMRQMIANKKEELIFAGDDNLYAAFREANAYNNFHDKRLPGNFDKMPLPTLFKKASDLLKSAD